MAPTLPLFDRPGGERVFSVAELNRAARVTLEGAFRDVWVEGELSDVTLPPSGHVYFTLNDGIEAAQVRGVMYRADARRAKAKLEGGARVKMRGSVSIYEPRGSYQLVARIALPAGKGDLHAEFERVRVMLEAEGLLAAERKRKLPRLPRVVGVVTSASGAALHDIVRVARGRCPVRILVSHCTVQGPDAPASITAALRALERVRGLDVVIIGRGGGSAEDLVAFNSERVARAIAACRVPIVSAVGHEVDVTIADLVADVRAATPSNAAELVVPDRRALVADLEGARRALERAMEVRLGRARLRLERFAQRVRDPRAALSAARGKLSPLERSLARAVSRRLAAARTALSQHNLRLTQLDPRRRLARDRAALVALTARIGAVVPSLVGHRRAALGHAVARLEALSPLAVLARGYAIALHVPTGRALVRASDARTGDEIDVVLHEGRLRARVEEREP